MLIYFGWIAAAFLLGFTLATHRRDPPQDLRRRVEKAAYFRSKSYTEIARELGEAHTAIRSSGDTILRTWTEDGYSITLLFDTQDNCLGVESET